MRVLVIGPSPKKSKGGMATVISEIQDDKELCQKYNIDIFESYIDGGVMIRTIYSIYAFLLFCLTRKGYDIYHIHMASRGSTFRKGFYVHMAKKWGKKVIVHIHGAQYMEFFEELSERKKRKVVDVLKSADCVIALSDEWKRKFEAAFGLTNCSVIENGIDLKRLERGQSDLVGTQKVFLMLGRLGERKGTYDLLDAVDIARNKIPDLKVYLAGDGEIEKIKEMVEKKKLQKYIKIVGWADFHTKLKLLKSCSTVILPSYNEGLPMAILEGMATGKAIISTYVGAIPEVIKEENGILVKPGDIEGLSQAIIRCSTDIKMLRRMAEKNVKKIHDHFSVEIMHKKLEKIYESIV